jgi:hypothetical protein
MNDHADVAPSRCPAWYILEGAEGTLYLLPAEALIGSRLPTEDAILLSAFVAGADLAGSEMEAALRLLTSRDDPSGRRSAVVATRQVRAWAVLG